MATRQRALRGEDVREFEGRVRQWKREWKIAENSSKVKRLEFYRWVATDLRDVAAPGKRHPTIIPLPTPSGKPLPPLFMRGAIPIVSAAPMPKISQKFKLSLGGGGGGAGQGSQDTGAAPFSPPAPSVGTASGPR